MDYNEHQAAEWSEELADASAADILRWANETFTGRVAFASSLGLEDQALTGLIAQHVPTLPIFTLGGTCEIVVFQNELKHLKLFLSL